MNENTTPRGIQSVRAESNIPELIRGVNAALGEFKAKNDTRLDTIERQLEQDATIAASRQMGNYDTKPASKFQAHFAAKPDYQASSEPVEMQAFLKGIAGLKTTEGVRAALAGGVDTTGGFTIPSRLAPSILDAMTAQSSVLTAGAGLTLIEPSQVFTTAAIDTIPSAAWRAESGSIAESDPAFRAILAAPKSLAFFFKISRELLADGTDLSRALTTAIAQSFALALDAAALRGSGTAPTPRGL
ncbi:MAG: phage major capsid protein, partial [Sphingomonadales bacterium]|nr:phage major capsid protein [Sphingomonadales bacterium]